MVVMVIVGSASRGVEGRDAVKVQHEIFPVAHRGVALIARNAHCGGDTEERSHVCEWRGEDMNILCEYPHMFFIWRRY